MEVRNEMRADFNLRKFFEILDRGKIIIILITVLSTITAAVYSVYFVKPAYQSYVSILFTGNNSRDTMVIFSDLIKSNNFAKTVSDNLDGSISYDKIHSAITTKYESTPILYIYANGESPQEAYDIANTIPKSAEMFLKSYIPSYAVEIIDKAEIDYKPINNNIYANTAIGFLTGLIVSVCLLVLASYFRN
jgi:capsular polysaccharide biosynthesis protein